MIIYIIHCQILAEQGEEAGVQKTEQAIYEPLIAAKQSPVGTPSACLLRQNANGLVVHRLT